MGAPFIYTAWVALSSLIVPFTAHNTTRKLRNAGVPIINAHETLGHATQDRHGSGPLIWVHSDSLSALALITRMGTALPQAHFLITSNTAISAHLMARRLPPRTLQQFAPLDAAGPLKRFLKHWRPDAAVLVQNELRPQTLRRTHASGAHMAMVSAQLSEKSITRWRKLPKLSAYTYAVFNLILAQNDAMAEVLVSLNAPADRVARGIDIGFMLGPLPVDEDALFEARAALGHRPVWIASSTHPGEEETVLKAHKALLKRFPDLCLILSPNDPKRGDEVTGLIAGAGLSLTRRTRGDTPGEQVFLADTPGEIGTWYALSDIVFLGGSLRPIGGHNPFEVAQSEAAVLSGIHVANFAAPFAEIEALGGARLIVDADDLSGKVNEWLSDDIALSKACEAAQAYAATQTDKLDGIALRLIKAMGLD